MSHQECSELLPWYVNGSLDEDERTSIATHLDGCATCRAELEEEEAIAAVLEPATDLDREVERGWRNMAKRLDRLQAKTHGRWRGAWWWPWSRMPRWAAAVALAQVLLLSALLLLAGNLYHRGRAQPRFHTLTQSEPQPAPARPLIHLVVSPATRVGDLRELLRRAGGEIVSGPSPAGVFTVAVSERDRSRSLTTLRRSPLVELAEPVGDDLDGR
ncbi:MAG TPA: zf-HC2 domain-containing protein [Thermoanaerobaculia bacterium]|nr:zf-HC2 domain-containing protein [Thermoanaerobaculia bacterium]